MQELDEGTVPTPNRDASGALHVDRLNAAKLLSGRRLLPNGAAR